MKPYVPKNSLAKPNSFPIFRESHKKLYVPKFYGIKNYGEPGKPKILPNSGAKMIARVKTTKDGNVIKGGQDTGKKPSDLM